MFMGNSDIFEDTHLRIDTVQEADFLYVGVPRASYGAVRIDDVWDCHGNKINIEDVLKNDWNNLRDSRGRRGLAEFAHLLNNCLNLNKTLLIANPDIFAHSFDNASGEHVFIITQGAIAAYYEKLGGKAICFGKPSSDIFEYARRKSNSKGSILMVGDSPWTDIAGANASGIDSALVTTTGIASEFMKRIDDTFTIEEKCQILFEEIAPKMTKLSIDVRPKYFLNSFVGEEIRCLKK
jgi:hypothetical protein